MLKIKTRKEKIIYLIFGAVLLFSIFLRVYHFDNWLFAKSDQVRDAEVSAQTYEKGIGELPLLGPRAGGTSLRLGPAFYYFQYASALLFQRTDLPVSAYPDLLFSILTIPLFFFFLRKFFSTRLSMALTAIFAFSFLAIEYSRFAWNPNSVPFFNLLFFYALLEIFDPEKKKKILWSVVVGIAFAVSTQLHFTSFVALPIILVLFFIFQRKNITARTFKTFSIFFVSSVLLSYLPVIISDVMMKGDNLREFFEAVKSKPSNKSFFQKISKEAYFFGKYYFRILTGYFGSNSKWFYGVWAFIAGALFQGWRFFIWLLR